MPFFILSEEPPKKEARKLPKLIPMNEFEKEPPPKVSGVVPSKEKPIKKRTTKEMIKAKERDDAESRVVALADSKPTKKQVYEFFKSRVEELTT